MKKIFFRLAEKGSHPLYPLDRRIEDNSGSIGLYDLVLLSFKGVVEIIKDGIALAFFFAIIGPIVFVASIPDWLKQHLNPIRIKATY